MSDWTRQGECNGCGHCCTYVGQSIIHFPIQPDKPVDMAYVTVRGFQVKEGMTGKPTIMGEVLLYSPCPKHDAAGKRCTVFETRPQQCRDFPASPEQIQDTPCSYWFERMAEDGLVQRIGGSGSPYPAQVV